MLKKWLDEHWYDWEADQTLLDDLKVFVEENVKQSGMENVATALSKLIAKKVNSQVHSHGTVGRRREECYHRV